METVHITFSADWNEEHQNILRARRQQAAAAHELGTRLLHIKGNHGWLEVADEHPFQTWTDYLARGVDVAVQTAYKYMAGAHFPSWCTDEVGIEKMALLKEITDLTSLEETPEEAMALELPVGDGKENAPFRELTVDEVAQALRLMRERNAPVKNLARRRPGQQVADDLRQKVSAAAQAWLTPEQIYVRPSGSDVLVDLRRVKAVDAKPVFAALAEAME